VENKKNKIITARLWPRYVGGIPSRAPIMLGLDSEKFETIFIYLKKDSNEPNYFELKGYRVYYISNKKYFRIFNLFAIFKLRKILKSENVEILHCHMHQSTIYGTIAAKLARVPIILSHVHGINRTKTWRRRLINSLLLRKVSKVLTVGEATREDVLRSNPSLHHQQVVSIGNSVDYEQYANVQISKTQAKKDLGLDEESFVFGTVGRLAATKGHPYLIRAFAKVKQKLPSAHLLIIGKGRLYDELKELTIKMDISEFVHLPGYREDIPQILRAMDVFVLSSLAEGLPRSLLEAMASGIPCVATLVSGVPEIFDGDKFGFAVPSKDEDRLAETMLKLAQMPEGPRKELIDSAKKRVRVDYSHEVVIERLENIYETEIRLCSKVI
jgi:glycosyltransferase involved in cell wall biosynthesis